MKKNFFKSVFALMCACMMTTSFVACGSDDDDNSGNKSEQPEKEVEPGKLVSGSAEFTVTPGNKGNYLLQGWALAKNNVKYEFVIKTAEEEEQGIENIELTEEAKKVVMDGSLYIVRDGKIFNAQGARVR